MSCCGCDAPQPLTLQCNGSLPTYTRPGVCARGSVYPLAWSAWTGGTFGASNGGETYYPRRLKISAGFTPWYLYHTSTGDIMDSNVWESPVYSSGGNDVYWRLTALADFDQPAKLEKIYLAHAPTGGSQWIVQYRSRSRLGYGWPEFPFELDPAASYEPQYLPYLANRASYVPSNQREPCYVTLDLNDPYNETVPAPPTRWNTAEVTISCHYYWHDDLSPRADDTTEDVTFVAQYGSDPNIKYPGRGAQPIWVADGYACWFRSDYRNFDDVSFDWRVGTFCEFYSSPFTVPAGGLGRVHVRAPAVGLNYSSKTWYEELPISKSITEAIVGIVGSRYKLLDATFTINSMSFQNA